MYQTRFPKQLSETLPTMYDLPSEDPEEPGLPDQFHDFQPALLRETCKGSSATDLFFGIDLNLYYDVNHTLWHKRPDYFLVVGVPAPESQNELRWSYVMWQEGVSPTLVVELLSPGTEDEDLGRKPVREVGKPPTKWEVSMLCMTAMKIYCAFLPWSKVAIKQQKSIGMILGSGSMLWSWD
jgi:Putative restriction endonuclease